jgi:hypothetical protein
MYPNRAVLRTKAAAKYLGLSESTLEKYRLTGEGPIYHKAGPKIVIYRPEDLDKWLNARRRRSTSETATAALGRRAIKLDRHTSKQVPVIWPSSVKTRNIDHAAYLDARIGALYAHAFDLDGPRAFECYKSCAAFHEAGHCILYALDGVIPLRATIWSIVVAGRPHWIGRTYSDVGYRINTETSPEADQKLARHQLAGVLAESLFDREHYRAGSSLDEIATAQLAIQNAAIKSGRKPKAMWLEMVAQLGATIGGKPTNRGRNRRCADAQACHQGLAFEKSTDTSATRRLHGK